MSAMSVLSATDVTIWRGPCEAVRRASLHCEAGQWLALVGPNGAGKSTLLSALAGLVPLAGGEVRLMAKTLSAWPAKARARQLAWLGQHVEFRTGLNVRDTVALGRMPHTGAAPWAREDDGDVRAIDTALRDTDLQGHEDRGLEDLSGGERQRTLLARALAVEAPVLLLDEPNSHLDAPHARALAQVIRRRTVAGGAVVSVLHDLNLALAADSMAVMCRGAVVCQGRTGDPEVHAALADVFEQALSVQWVAGRWLVVPDHGTLCEEAT